MGDKQVTAGLRGVNGSTLTSLRRAWCSSRDPPPGEIIGLAVDDGGF